VIASSFVLDWEWKGFARMEEDLIGEGNRREVCQYRPIRKTAEEDDDEDEKDF